MIIVEIYCNVEKFRMAGLKMYVVYYIYKIHSMLKYTYRAGLIFRFIYQGMSKVNYPKLYTKGLTMKK